MPEFKFPLKLHGLTEEEFCNEVVRCFPEFVEDRKVIKQHIPYIKRQVSPYQGALLYALAKHYQHNEILEIGTAWGFSAANIATAAPLSRIQTLNPKDTEVPYARKHLKFWGGVTVHQMTSMEYYGQFPNEQFDFIFVDGNHDLVWMDCLYWFRLNPGGLILFHDYSPDGSGRPCRPVYDALNRWLIELGRTEFDVSYVDNRGIGMVGLFRQYDEILGLKPSVAKAAYTTVGMEVFNYG